MLCLLYVYCRHSTRENLSLSDNQESCQILEACQRTCSSVPPPPTTGNPFDPMSSVYVNPTLAKNIQGTIDRNPGMDSTTKQNMIKMSQQPSAYWIDVKEKINLPTDVKEEDRTIYVEGILDDVLKQGKQAVCLIVYDLPNRDCHAVSSNGQLCCNQSAECSTFCSQDCQRNATDCQKGLEDYRKQYIDPLVTLFKKSKYDTIRKILIIEPDSLPNCSTDSVGDRGCTNVTCQAYREGITYAINQLSAVPNVFMYLDTGHNAWLGWQNNLMKFMDLVAQLPTQKLRGFAMNVANYQLLGKPCSYPTNVNVYNDYNTLVTYCRDQHPSDECCKDPCNMIGQYNAATNLHNYVQLLLLGVSQHTPPILFKDGEPRFVMDTGRNGNPGAFPEFQACPSWCNLRNAKVGVFPTTNTALSQIDAYFWLKTPGESDGCIDHRQQQTCTQEESSGTCVRYDTDCNNQFSIGSRQGEPCPPEAGHWFDYQIQQLNA